MMTNWEFATVRLFIMVLLLASPLAKADWSATTRVGEVNVGGNGLYGTFVGLVNFSFSGCSSGSVGFIDGSNPNYREILTSILAAKLADKNVKIGYSDCNAGYSIIREVVVL